MTPAHKRLVALGYVGYLAVVAFLVFEPVPDVPSSSVAGISDMLGRAGAPTWLAMPSRVEFLCNVAMFVPLSLVGSVLWPRRSWLGWTGIGLCGTVFIETTQYFLLPDRSAMLSDIVANTLGATIGAFLAAAVRSRLRRPRSAARRSRWP